MCMQMRTLLVDKKKMAHPSANMARDVRSASLVAFCLFMISRGVAEAHDHIVCMDDLCALVGPAGFGPDDLRDGRTVR